MRTQDEFVAARQAPSVRPGHEGPRHAVSVAGHDLAARLRDLAPIDDARVQSELTRYLSDNWAPIIEKDVDGPNSLPLKIDAEQPNLGKLHATRTLLLGIFTRPVNDERNRQFAERGVWLDLFTDGQLDWSSLRAVLDGIVY